MFSVQHDHSYLTHESDVEAEILHQNIEPVTRNPTSKCPTLGCDGNGHVISHFSGHRSLSGCPTKRKDMLRSLSCKERRSSPLKCPTRGCGGSGNVSGILSTHRTTSGCPNVQKAKLSLESEEVVCPAPGCDGTGNINSSFPTHRSLLSCPLAQSSKYINKLGTHRLKTKDSDEDELQKLEHKIIKLEKGNVKIERQVIRQTYDVRALEDQVDNHERENKNMAVRNDNITAHYERIQNNVITTLKDVRVPNCDVLEKIDHDNFDECLGKLQTFCAPDEKLTERNRCVHEKVKSAMQGFVL